MPAITTAVLATAALATTAVGAYTQYQGAKDVSEAQQTQVGAEQRIEAQRMKAMELDARRKQMEIVRQAQRAQSLGLVNATAQGAGQGSGLQGGMAQISGAMGSNLLGVTQNLGIGRNIFGENATISGARMDIAEAGSNISFGQGLSSLGGAFMSSANAAGSLSAGFGKYPSLPGTGPYPLKFS